MKTDSLSPKLAKRVCGLVLTALFSGCGGGSGSDEPAHPPVSVPAPPSAEPDCKNAPGNTFFGVNGHLADKTGAYAVSFDKQIKRLQDLGVRFYRSNGAGSEEGLEILARFADEAKKSCIELRPVIGIALPATEQGAYTQGFEAGQRAAKRLKGKVEQIEIGNELDSVKGLKIRGNGTLPTDWDPAKVEIIRSLLLGMLDGVQSTAPEMKVVYNNGIPLGHGLLKMLWYGTDPAGHTGHPVFRPDKVSVHWYGSSGNILTTRSNDLNEAVPAYFNLLEYLHNEFGVELDIGEMGGFEGAVRNKDNTLNPKGTEQAKADYINKVIPQYCTQKSHGVTGVTYYQLYDTPSNPPGFNYSLLKDETEAGGVVYNAFKNQVLACQ